MKKIENYKKEIANRISILMILCVLALLAVLIGNFFIKDIFPSKENITDFVIGFFIGLEILCVFYMGVLHRIYTNERLLKKMYIKETDEREILIRLKSGTMIIPFFSIIIVIISFIIAYISEEAFVTLIMVAFAQIIISKLLEIYWSKKL